MITASMAAVQKKQVFAVFTSAAFQSSYSKINRAEDQFRATGLIVWLV